MFGRKRKDEGEPDAAPATADPATEPVPREPRCLEPGCPSKSFDQCEYRDGKGALCDATWCRRHIDEFRGISYCRRHVGVMREIYRSNVLAYKPDKDNRALSLANWIAKDLDPLLQAALPSIRSDIHIRGESAQLIRGDDGHRWQRAWEIIPPPGPALRIVVETSEADDRTVRVLVDGNVIHASVPPWIEQRIGDQAEDTRRRGVYYAGMCDAVVEVLRSRIA